MYYESICIYGDHAYPYFLFTGQYLFLVQRPINDSNDHEQYI